jgi:hypothetical protein
LRTNETSAVVGATTLFNRAKLGAVLIVTREA